MRAHRYIWQARASSRLPSDHGALKRRTILRLIRSLKSIASPGSLKERSCRQVASIRLTAALNHELRTSDRRPSKSTIRTKPDKAPDVSRPQGRTEETPLLAHMSGYPTPGD